jgi:hypothetical protein
MASRSHAALLTLTVLAAYIAGIPVLNEIGSANHLQCSDSADNDRDGKIDFPSDPGCSSSADTTEADTAATSSGSSVSSAAVSVRASSSSSSSTTVQNTTTGTFELAITDNHEMTKPGDTLSYNIVIKNTAATAQVVDVRAALSEFVIFQNAQPDATVNVRTVEWSDIVFGPSERKSFRVRAVVEPSAQFNSTITTQAVIGSFSVSDTTSIQTSGTANSVASVASVASSASAISSSSSVKSSVASSAISSSSKAMVPSTRVPLITKTANSDEVVAGGRVLYTLRVQNVLLTVIDDGVITDRFDSAILSVSDSGGGVKMGSGQLKWILPTLKPGQVWEKTYALTAASTIADGTQLSNVATIAGMDVADASLEDRTVTVRTSVMPHLPSTGAAYDLLYVLGTVPAAGIFTAMQRKLKRA